MSSDRVLIWLKPNYLGDAVMATPLLDGLIEHADMPLLIAGKPVVQVLHDRVDRLGLIKAANLRNPLSLIKQARALVKLRIDVAILVNRSFRSALCARIAGIPKRVGHDTEGRGFLLTERLPYDENKFEADCYLDLARAAGFDLPHRKPSLKVTDDEKSIGAMMLDGATIGVQPGARYVSKRLPLATAAGIVDTLSARGFRIALLGGREESERASQLAGSVSGKGILNLVGCSGLREAKGILSNLRLMIGSDTGLMHVAAALGTPTITVFGPNPLSKWGHDYPPHLPIQAPDGKMSNVEIESIIEPALAMMKSHASAAGIFRG